MSICKTCGTDDRYPSGTCRPCTVKRNRAREANGIRNIAEHKANLLAEANNRAFILWGLHHAS
jgi:hypothetical protein